MAKTYNLPFKDGEIKIKTPGGTTTVRLQWAKGIEKKYTGKFHTAQVYIDNEALKGCSKRVSFRTGGLMRDGIANSPLGGGKIVYTAPHARPQYYKTATTRSYDPNRGAYWFDRMKAAEKTRILAGAKRIIGGN